MRFFVSISVVLWLAHGLTVAWAGTACDGRPTHEHCCCAPKTVMAEAPSCCPEETPAPVDGTPVSDCDCEVTTPDAIPAEAPLALRETRHHADPVYMTFAGAEDETFRSADSRVSFFSGPPGRSPPGVRLPILFCSFRC